MGIFLGRNFLGGNCPVEIIRVVIFRVGVFLVAISSGRSLGQPRFFAFKMVTSLPEDSFCLRYVFSNSNTVYLRRFGKSAWYFLTALAMFVLAAYRPILSFCSGEYLE